MLTDLTISNVQSIRKLHAELGPITVFYGESDSGKSAIVRALYGLAFNDWPDGFVTMGEANAGVAVTLDDGRVVAAAKGKTANSYGISGESALRFDRVGRDVPAEVADALGWRELELDDGTKIKPSFAKQFDEPFLLAMTPSRVASVLGGLTNIARLYAAIRAGANKERSARRSAEEAQSRVSEHGQTLASLRSDLVGAQVNLDGIADRVVRVKQAYDRWLALEKLDDRVRDGQRLYQKAKDAVVELRRRAAVVPDLGARVDLLMSRRTMAQRYRDLEKMTQHAVDVRTEATSVIQDVIREVAEFKKVTGVCPVCEKPW